MTVGKLFALFIALAVLIAPGVTSVAMAAAPRHDMEMIAAGHCQSMPHDRHQQKMADKSCCIAMCVAVAVTPSTPAETSPLHQQIAHFALPRTYLGLHTEIATPPPRRA